MKAIVKKKPASGAYTEDVKKPEISPNELLVRIRGAGICGTDLHIYDWDESMSARMNLPRVIGHEFTGEVEAVGEGVTKIKVGDLISAESHIVCGNCSHCRRGEAHVCKNTKILGIDVDGGFAEYVKIPEENAWTLNNNLPMEVSAVMEPFGNAVHAVLAEDITGKSLAIFGCGPIGLFALGIARVSGATSIFAIETKEYRRNLAEKMGATRVYDPVKDKVVEEILRETQNEGVDIVLEMSGNPNALHQGFKVLTPGGRFTAFGIPAEPLTIDLSEEIIFKGVHVLGIIGRRLPETWHKTFSILTTGLLDIKPIITHQFPMDQFEEAIQLIKTGDCGKVVLIP
jgi:threonine 3-dehydrogenase